MNVKHSAVSNTPQDAVNERLNSYEMRQEAKRARFEEKAHAARQQSDKAFTRAQDMGAAIPMGQPILVGHHSERRDRNYRGRIESQYRQSIEAQKKADYYAQKANSVGTGGISSDDPDAIKKLQRQLEEMMTAQEKMKAANKEIRKHKTTEAQVAALVALGYGEKIAGELVKPDCCGRIGFPDYRLTNNNANIRRVKARIEQLQQEREQEDVEMQGDGYVYREDTVENRVMFTFREKPSKAVRQILKDNGFRWSPSRDGKPWVRQLNNRARWIGQDTKKEIDAMLATKPR